MFREYVKLIDESVDEGANKGIQLFLETINNDLELEEINEQVGGIEETVKRIFHENGFTITDLEPLHEDDSQNKNEDQLLDEALDSRLDEILSELKKEGIVD